MSSEHLAVRISALREASFRMTCAGCTGMYRGVRGVRGVRGCQGVSGVSGNARGVREVHGDAQACKGACKGVQGAACIPWFYRV